MGQTRCMPKSLMLWTEASSKFQNKDNSCLLMILLRKNQFLQKKRDDNRRQTMNHEQMKDLHERVGTQEEEEK